MPIYKCRVYFHFVIIPETAVHACRIAFAPHIRFNSVVMLDFICMGPVDLAGARRKRENRKWNFVARGSHNSSDLQSDALPTELSGLNESSNISIPFIHTCTSDTNVRIYWYKFENNEIERYFYFKCAILCYILEYICIARITKRLTNSVFALNMQTRSNILPDLVFECWKQTQDLWVSLIHG